MGKLINRVCSRQLILFGVVGVVTNVIGYLLYLLVTSAGLTPKLTMSFLYVVGSVLGFVGNRHLTFQRSGETFSAGIRYAIAYFLGYLINVAILIIFVDHLEFDHRIVQGIAILIIAVLLFVLLRTFVFPSPNRSARAENT